MNIIKMPKKIFFIFLGIILILILPVNVVHADKLTVISKAVPYEKEEIVKKNWESFLNIFLINSDEAKDSFYLGSGFTPNSTEGNLIINFPIIKKETKDISYILQIDEHNQILLSKKLATELNNVSKECGASEEEQIKVFNSEQSVFYSEENGELKRLVGHDDLSLESSSNIFRSVDEFAVQITDILAEPHINELRASASYDHVLYPWKVYEIQKEKPWCEWYATTGIVNNLAGKNVITAEQMIREQYPKATDAQLNDAAWIVQQKLQDNFDFLKNKYAIFVKLKMGPPSFSEVKSELKQRNAPIITDLEDKNGKDYGHAIVQIGYTASSSEKEKPYYYYWNPWWEDTFVVSSEAKYMQLMDKQYIISRFQYNFSKPKL